MDKQLQKFILDLQEISVLAYELFRYDLSKQNISESDLITQAWLKSHHWINSPQSLCFGKTPLEVIFTNDGESIKNFLKDKMGVKHE